MLRVWRLLQPTMSVGPKPAKSVSCCRTAKWHDPLEEIREEEGLLTRRIGTISEGGGKTQFPRYGRHWLMRKMASPRTQDVTALKRVAQVQNQIPANDLQISMDQSDNN